ncbi:hypothetical protein Q5P01_002888 [Channa striata]|uniref:Ig-like domain-containing protein n=1 Tax=Channa striata TaxID=64152 RepID=A0AA88NRW3_CHASR|nr:hypothetical protein Q5P01_002888 [Channa striata]
MDRMSCKSQDGARIFYYATAYLLLAGFDEGQSQPILAMLIVGAVIEVDTVSSGVLQCESKGWYPEPEVLWLDGEGHVLSAGPTETVRGPYDLYTVSSRVTVDKRQRNRFICRVQQTNINQSRETAIDVPDEFFTESTRSYTLSIIIGVVFGILFVLVAAFLGWKWRENRTRDKKMQEDEEKLSGGENKNNGLCEDPEQESLLPNKTDKGQMGNLEKVEEEAKKNMPLNEEEIKQEQHMEQTKTNNSSVQTNRKGEEKSLNVGTGSEFVMDDERRQYDIQTTVDKKSEKEETKFLNSDQSDQGLMDVNVQQPHVNEEGQETNDDKKKSEGHQTQPENDETTNGDASDETTKQPKVSPDGDMNTGMEQRHSPAETGGGKQDRDDKNKTTSVVENSAPLCSLGGGTNQHESSTNQEEKREEKENKSADQGNTLKETQKDSDADKNLTGTHTDHTTDDSGQKGKTEGGDTNPTTDNTESQNAEGDGAQETNDDNKEGEGHKTQSGSNETANGDATDETTQQTHVSSGGDIKTGLEQSQAGTDGGHDDVQTTVDKASEKGETTFLNSDQSDQGLMDVNVQQPHVTEEGQEKNDDKKEGEGHKTQSGSNETTNGDASDETTKQPKVSPDGDKKTGMEQRHSPAETGGGKQDRDDKNKTTSVVENSAPLCSLGGGTRKVKGRET